MKEKMAIPDELLSKISGAGDELNDQDKETLGALASIRCTGKASWPTSRPSGKPCN